MRIRSFCLRTAKEILRDPLTLVFGLGFPLVVLFLLSVIQANIPVEMFVIERLAPGIVVFGLSFISLFTATLVAKDRETAFLQRLYTTPLKAGEFILGYALPVLPIASAQSAVCYLAAFCLGLTPSLSVLYAWLASIPVALLFISLGVLFGSLLSVKGASGICGALLTNLSAWLSGIWFDLRLVGGAFEKIADLLPFVHAVELGRVVLSGGFSFAHIAWVGGYAAVCSIAAVWCFLRQMKK